MADFDKIESGRAVAIGDIGSGVGGGDAAVEERERLCSTELEGISVLDFDLLCSTVALQTQGKWRKLDNSEGDDAAEDEYGGGGGGVLRVWEGDVMDCLENRHLCIESACCPCYRFGKNMSRSGFGSCFLQGLVHMILIVGIVFNVAAFAVTKRHCFLYLAAAFVLLIVSYLGFFRMQIRMKFNIRGGDSFFDDCIHHLACPFCTLTQVCVLTKLKPIHSRLFGFNLLMPMQESKTLEMNNVHDGIWHGRGDTMCIGGYSEGKALLGMHSPPVIVQAMSS
ncbi:unnamed protein product [Cochlearia groenlandica]